MFLNELSLVNYRNFYEFHLDFTSNFTVIEAPNASGKSNLLEAIYMLSYPRPVRDINDSDLINWESSDNWMRIEGRYDNKNINEIFIQKNNSTSKVLKVNGIKVRSTDFVGNFFVILFSTSVLNILVLSPLKRRNFLDRSLSMLFPNYLNYIIEYEKVVKNRNRVLSGIKKGFNSKEELIFWDAQLKELGQFIVNKRKEFTKDINEILSDFKNIKFPLRMFYEPIFDFNLSLPVNREIEAGITLVGPHREDWKLMAGDRNLAVFGSRGEQRLGILYLQFSLYKMIENNKKIKSVLLLDDLNSELDSENLSILVDAISNLKGQSIITTTNKDLYNVYNCDIKLLRH